jgi:hypothetical protein
MESPYVAQYAANETPKVKKKVWREQEKEVRSEENENSGSSAKSSDFVVKPNKKAKFENFA